MAKALRRGARDLLGDGSDEDSDDEFTDDEEVGSRSVGPGSGASQTLKELSVCAVYAATSLCCRSLLGSAAKSLCYEREQWGSLVVEANQRSRPWLGSSIWPRWQSASEPVCRRREIGYGEVWDARCLSVRSPGLPSLELFHYLLQCFSLLVGDCLHHTT